MQNKHEHTKPWSNTANKAASDKQIHIITLGKPRNNSIDFSTALSHT